MPPLQTTTVRVAAQAIQFSTSALAGAANTLVRVEYNNTDAGVPHNIHFFAGDGPAAPSLGSTSIENGPVVQTLDLGALGAGSYYYQCDVHSSNMNGTLTLS